MLMCPNCGAAAAATDVQCRYCKVQLQTVACPSCLGMNFARLSGVIVDVCKRHGTWFDRDELRQIVEFIRGGGLDAARDKERAQLEVEKQRLKDRERASAAMPVYPADEERDYGGIVAAA